MTDEYEIKYKFSITNKPGQGLVFGSPELITNTINIDGISISDIFTSILTDETLEKIMSNRIDTDAGAQEIIAAKTKSDLEESKLKTGIIKETTDQSNLIQIDSNFATKLQDNTGQFDGIIDANLPKLPDNLFHRRLIQLIEYYNTLTAVIKEDELFTMGKFEVNILPFTKFNINDFTKPSDPISLASFLFYVAKTFMRIPIVLLTASTDLNETHPETEVLTEVLTEYNLLKSHIYPTDISQNKKLIELFTRSNANMHYNSLKGSNISIDMLCFLLIQSSNYFDNAENYNYFIVSLCERMIYIINYWCSTGSNKRKTDKNTKLGILHYTKISKKDEKDRYFASILQKIHNQNDNLITFVKVRMGRTTLNPTNNKQIDNDNKTMNIRYSGIQDDDPKQQNKQTTEITKDRTILNFRYDDNITPFYKDCGIVNVDGTKTTIYARYDANCSQIPSLTNEQYTPQIKIESVANRVHYNHDFNLGPFTYIYKQDEFNAEITNSTIFKEKILKKLIDGNPVSIIGYGASGSGKTSVLIQLSAPNKEPEPGILMYLSNALGDSSFNICDVQIIEFGKIGSDNPGNANETAFIGSYIFNEKKTWKSIGYKNPDNTNVTNPGFFFMAGRKYCTHGSMFTDILRFMELERIVRKTPNNPVSSRTHLIISLKYYKSDSNSDIRNLFICDLAGVENTFECASIIDNDIGQEQFDTKIVVPKDPRCENAEQNESSILTIDYYGEVDKIDKDCLYISNPDLTQNYIQTYTNKYKKDIKNTENGILDKMPDMHHPITTAANNMKKNSFIIRNMQFSLGNYFNEVKNKVNTIDGLLTFVDQLNKYEIPTATNTYKVNGSTNHMYILNDYDDSDVCKGIPITIPVYPSEIFYESIRTGNYEKQFFEYINTFISLTRNSKVYSIYRDNIAKFLNTHNFNSEAVNDIMDFILNRKNTKISNISEITKDNKLSKYFLSTHVPTGKYNPLEGSKQLTMNNNGRYMLPFEFLLNLNNAGINIVYGGGIIHSITFDSLLNPNLPDNIDIKITQSIFPEIDLNKKCVVYNKERLKTMPKVEFTCKFVINDIIAALNNKLSVSSSEINPLVESLYKLKYTKNIDNDITKIAFIKYLKTNFLKEFDPSYNVFQTQVLLEQLRFGYESVDRNLDLTHKEQKNTFAYLEEEFELKSQNIQIGGGMNDECRARTNEGIYINKFLKEMREGIPKYVSKINPRKGMPSFFSKCLPLQCNPEFKECLGINNYDPIPVNKGTESYGELVDMIKKYSTASELPIVFCVFCILNLSEPPLVRDPPPVAYVDLTKLQQLYQISENFEYEKEFRDMGTLVNQIQAEMNRIITSGQYKYKGRTNNEIDNIIKNLPSSSSDIGNFNKNVNAFIKIISNINAATPIGTVLFTDSVAKNFVEVNTCNTYQQFNYSNLTTKQESTSDTNMGGGDIAEPKPLRTSGGDIAEPKPLRTSGGDTRKKYHTINNNTDLSRTTRRK